MIESLNKRIATVWIATLVALSILLLPVYANSATSAVHHRGTHIGGVLNATSDEHGDTGQSATESGCEKSSSGRSENSDGSCCDVGCPTLEVFALVYVSTGFIPQLNHEQSHASALVSRHSSELKRPPRN